MDQDWMTEQFLANGVCECLVLVLFCLRLVTGNLVERYQSLLPIDDIVKVAIIVGDDSINMFGCFTP